MPQLPDMLDELSARFAMYDYLLEQLYANTFSALPAEESAKLKTELKDRLSKPRDSSKEIFADSRKAQAIVVRVSELANGFFVKVSESEQALRKME